MSGNIFRHLACALAAAMVVTWSSLGLAQSVDAANRCKELTVSTDPSMPSKVLYAMAVLHIDVPFEALATCRKALAATPSDKALIESEDVATEAVTVLALGNQHPAKREDSVAMALAQKPRAGSFEEPLIAFYIGSAYAFGAGVAKDKTIAVLWLSKALSITGPARDVVEAELRRLLEAPVEK